MRSSFLRSFMVVTNITDFRGYVLRAAQDVP